MAPAVTARPYVSQQLGPWGQGGDCPGAQLPASEALQGGLHPGPGPVYYAVCSMKCFMCFSVKTIMKDDTKMTVVMCCQIFD